MANRDTPNGFTAPKSNVPTNAIALETLWSDGTTTIGVGDAVIPSTTVQGSYERKTADRDDTDNTLVTTHICQEYVPATVGAKFKAIPVEGHTFEIQVDDDSLAAATETLQQLNVGLTYGLIYGTPSATLGNSIMELDGSDTTSSDVTVVDYVRRPDNDNTLANNRVRVKFSPVADLIV